MSSNGTLFGEQVIGTERAQKLSQAMEAICAASVDGNEEPERVFDGAAQNLMSWREAAQWAADEWGGKWSLLVEALD